MTWPQLTLLQRGVIHRLREAGLTEVADAVSESWRNGGRILAFEPKLIPDEELRRDFERANAQATQAG